MSIVIYLFILQISSVFSNALIQWSTLNHDDNPIIDSALLINQDRATFPQSLTLLMNFKYDGTTSFQIMHGSNVIYIDSGYCKHGQLFDPTTGKCRDISCQYENYKFNGTTCVLDTSKNMTTGNKRMSDIDLLLTFVISPKYYNENYSIEFSRPLHSRMNETCTKNWTKMFHDTLQSYLNIDTNRMIKLNYTIENDDKITHNVSTMNYIIENEKYPSILYPDTRADDVISQRLSQNQSVTVKLKFSIVDRNETSNDTLVNLHFVTLLLIASDVHIVIDICQNYTMKINAVTIVSDKNKTQHEFCNDPDVLYPTKNGTMHTHVKSNGELDYYVYVPELETRYESGDYTFIFIVSTYSRLQDGQPQNTSLSLAHLTNSTSAGKIVSVCNRQPRIVGHCPDSLVMRIALCEVIQYQNFSIRLKRNGRLYTNREYRYDDYLSDMYVVVCKHDMINDTVHGENIGFFEKAPGLLSTIAIFLSIIALAITLFTFLLFPSLRNLPGCNTINLIIALMLAEIFFLFQSLFIVTRPGVCLFFALGIHFFFLASFFWMNVMAYDLWRTFHKGFSLFVYEIRERLPHYALYAWGAPMVIVAIGIVLDGTNAKLKPCYARFFRGCHDVCFKTLNDAPLNGCWIESALMRFLLFGLPVAIILIINFIFYTLTVRSIRNCLKSVRVQFEGKFQRKKQVLPGEHDVKIYMRMAALAGFGWTIGFILFAIPDNKPGFQHYLVAIFKYLFIILNCTPGLFIFAVYVCNKRVLLLYRVLIRKIFQSTKPTPKCHGIYFHETKNQFIRLKAAYLNRNRQDN